MSTTTETTIVTLDQIEVKNLPELQGWKDKQHAIVKENPFIGIEDHKSYEEAKKHRTALVSARTTIQNQDKLIAKKLKELRTEAGNVSKELIEITLPHEEKQQEEVKRYEAKKEEERLEKERIEQERKGAIQKSISDFYSKWKKTIAENLTFKNIDDVKLDLVTAIDEQKEKDLEEFELDFTEKKNLLISQFDERVKYLTEQEEARAERERLEAERKEFEEQKRKEEEARKLREEEERKKREAEEAERKAKEEAERKVRELEAEKLRKEREELETQKRKLEQEEAERQRKIEAERKAKEEAELKAKQEAEEKARQEAEAKRLKELQPDKEKLVEFIHGIQFTVESPELKDEALTSFLNKTIHDLEVWKKASIDKIEEIK
tara:strand:- start:481 stop:1617 length:1137 start_codon:yes stop_codon:yes gene_type:complete